MTQISRRLSIVIQIYLTYVVVNIIHHRRFLRADLNDNFVTDTVIDSPDITNRITNDFQFNSHHRQLL
jgi:hypothetical protein